ncbi:MAG TPA: hypothetical protein VH397_13660 [Xanthobacteraceae bacterium]
MSYTPAAGAAARGADAPAARRAIEPRTARAARAGQARGGWGPLRFMTAGALAGCLCLAPIADANAVPWTSAKIPGEQDRAVQGCVDNPEKAGDWLCIIVRCDNPRSPLSLHFSAPGDIEGNIELVVDENTFALAVAKSPKSPLALSTRAQAVPNGLLDAMKSGHMISIQGSRFQSPHNQISLENSRNAIERVERACGRGFSGPGGFWRRLMRSVGVD